MSGKLISIIFCGGCNPKINRGRIAELVSAQLARFDVKVSFNCRDADFFVFLSGFPVGCAERKFPVEAPFIVVAGSSINSITFEENSLAAEIITRGRNHFEKLQRNL